MTRSRGSCTFAAKLAETGTCTSELAVRTVTPLLFSTSMVFCETSTSTTLLPAALRRAPKSCPIAPAPIIPILIIDDVLSNVLLGHDINRLKLGIYIICHDQSGSWGRGGHRRVFLGIEVLQAGKTPHSSIRATASISNRRPPINCA